MGRKPAYNEGPKTLEIKAIERARPLCEAAVAGPGNRGVLDFVLPETAPFDLGVKSCRTFGTASLCQPFSGSLPAGWRSRTPCTRWSDRTWAISASRRKWRRDSFTEVSNQS